MQRETQTTASPVRKLRPIIKWTGGKYDEFPLFASYIPAFENYYEPFFGGGGVFFALQPRQHVYINDKSEDLVNFYKSIYSQQFKAQLFLYADAWEQAGKLALFLTDALLNSFRNFVHDNISSDKIDRQVKQTVDNLYAQQFYPLFEESFIISPAAFKDAVAGSLIDKFKRIKRICKKESRVFNHDELADHIETGTKSGLYLYLRSVMNDCAKKRISVSPFKTTANWYFVREFCYASMFRYNSNGVYNIPYGGIAYNKKNFRQKAENIFSDEVHELFRNSKIYNLDFEEFFKLTSPQAGDFTFIDPPYDSDFSEYDQNAFTQKDHQRLRNVLLGIKGKWMLVIKKTKFITELYACPGLQIIEFDKKYTYNVRGRNNRDSSHLIIINYSAENL